MSASNQMFPADLVQCAKISIPEQSGYFNPRDNFKAGVRASGAEITYVDDVRLLDYDSGFFPGHTKRPSNTRNLVAIDVRYRRIPYMTAPIPYDNIPSHFGGLVRIGVHCSEIFHIIDHHVKSPILTEDPEESNLFFVEFDPERWCTVCIQRGSERQNTWNITAQGIQWLYLMESPGRRIIIAK